jgi:hypothetical protein
MRHYDPDTSLISSALTAATVRRIGSLATDPLNRNGKKLAIKRPPSVAGGLFRVATVKAALALALALARGSSSESSAKSKPSRLRNSPSSLPRAGTYPRRGSHELYTGLSRANASNFKARDPYSLGIANVFLISAVGNV